MAREPGDLVELIHEPSLWEQPFLWVMLGVAVAFLVIGGVAAWHRVWGFVAVNVALTLMVTCFAFMGATKEVVSKMTWQGTGTLGTVLPTPEGATYVQLSGDTGIIRLDYVLDPGLTGTDVMIQCGKYDKGYYSDCEFVSFG